MQGRALLTAAGMVAAAAILASCASKPPVKTARGKEYFSERDYGVKASPRVVAYGEKVPQGGGRRMVGKAYKVAGKTYKPRIDEDYTAVGTASWYGAAFHGRLTANGEVYDMDGLSAAHPTMPLPSYARVTNLQNGRSLVVRVNDRGPYHSNRVMDLSAKAAELLDTKRHGIGKIKVEYLGPARMEGHDQKMLLATYNGPGSNATGSSSGSMLAFLGVGNKRERVRDSRPAPEAVMVAMAPPPRERPATADAFDAYAVDPYTYAVIAAREQQGGVAVASTNTGLAPAERSLGTIAVSQPVGYGEAGVIPAAWSEEPVFAPATEGNSFAPAPEHNPAHAAAAGLAREIDLATALDAAAGREAERRGLTR